MKKNKYLWEWMKIVSKNMSHLSLPQVSGLATWSFGMVMTQSSSISRVSELIAKLNNEKSNTVRQRLKEWYQEKEAKKGKKRTELIVSDCFVPLLKWIISLLPSENKQLPLAIDATNIKQVFTVLSLNVLYQGCSIPIAWKIVIGTEKGSWKPYWRELLKTFKSVIPSDWLVIVTADRGLYARWLFEEIVNIGWHPFLRINHQGTYQLKNHKSWFPLNKIISIDDLFSQKVTCFKTNPLQCTLLGQWKKNYQAPWLIVTDLEPKEANIAWYGFRSWIESGYRDFKSDGWLWHNTRLLNPNRAERLWLAMAVATLWVISQGDNNQVSPYESISPNNQVRFYPRFKPTNNLSCFLNGLLNIVVNFLQGHTITLFPLSCYHFPTPVLNSS